ncbi:unnamed protein product [Brachionus calyciflorus]|uniref:R3H domain-containing protein n=1 Tax=Brachionus calyciflorus TaxID=104777 RepID=A0A814J8U0_9BILA|nr:unnamed protein product [Brachionus calyciflorus]
MINVSIPVINRCFKLMRFLCRKKINKDELILGGNGQVIEIDESLFVRVKHGKGKDLKRERIWVFVMYERGSSRCLFFFVQKRDAVNLLNLIYKHIAPNSIIHSDCWAAYNRIQYLNKNYTHLTVDHDLHFVDPKTRVQTNSIESVWNSAKIHLKKMRGVNRNYLQSYLDEFTWRHNQNLTRNGAFEAILDVIAEAYNPESGIQFDKKDQDLDKIEEDIFDGDINDFFYDGVTNVYLAETNESISSILNLSNVEYSCLYLSEVIQSEFISAVNIIINEIFENKIFSFEFRSNLSNEQRKIIHELCEKVGLKHETRGTRYKKLVISKFDNVERNDIDSLSAEFVKFSIAVPRDEHVQDVVNIPVKRQRGRPKKN